MFGFHKVASLFIFIFLGIMVAATYIALQRKSGNTGMDMGKIEQLRKKIIASP